jgi:hypothetical protein
MTAKRVESAAADLLLQLIAQAEADVRAGRVPDPGRSLRRPAGAARIGSARALLSSPA